MCLEPECEPSLTWDCWTGDPQFDLGFSVVSLELGDSDRPWQSQGTEEFVVVFIGGITILSDVGRLSSQLLVPTSASRACSLCSFHH